MTRINLIPVEELHYKHLVAEYRELPRVVDLARKLSPKEKVPTFRMGTGHVKFFYDKILFLKNRQDQLIAEMIKRGYEPNFTSTEKFLDVDPALLNDWTPSEKDIAISRARIEEKLAKMVQKEMIL